MVAQTVRPSPGTEIDKSRAESQPGSREVGGPDTGNVSPPSHLLTLASSTTPNPILELFLSHQHLGKRLIISHEGKPGIVILLLVPAMNLSSMRTK